MHRSRPTSDTQNQISMISTIESRNPTRLQISNRIQRGQRNLLSTIGVDQMHKLMKLEPLQSFLDGYNILLRELDPVKNHKSIRNALLAAQKGIAIKVSQFNNNIKNLSKSNVVIKNGIDLKKHYEDYMLNVEEVYEKIQIYRHQVNLRSSYKKLRLLANRKRQNSLRKFQQEDRLLGMQENNRQMSENSSDAQFSLLSGRLIVSQLQSIIIQGKALLRGRDDFKKISTLTPILRFVQLTYLQLHEKYSKLCREFQPLEQAEKDTKQNAQKVLKQILDYIRKLQNRREQLKKCQVISVPSEIIQPTQLLETPSRNIKLSPKKIYKKTPVLCFRQDELLNPIIPMLRKFIEPKKRRLPTQTKPREKSRTMRNPGARPRSEPY